MAKVLHVTVSKVDGAVFDGEATSVTLPGVEGELTVLPDHTAFITPLRAGTVTVRTAEGTEVFVVEGGVLEVSGNRATVLL